MKTLDDNARVMNGEVLDPFEGERMPPPRRKAARPAPWTNVPSELHPELCDAPKSKGRAVRLPFPIAALHPWVADYVAAVAVATQTPVDMGGVIALGVLATAVAGKALVQAAPQHVEPLNAFFLVLMKTGNRKSGVFKLMFSPVTRYEEELQQQAKSRLAVAQAERRSLEDEAKALRNKLRGASPAERAEIDRDIQENARKQDELGACVEPVLYLQDTTPEKLAKVIEDQGGRVSVGDSEGVFIDQMLGHYNEGAANYGNLLKGHSGDEIRVERMGRPMLRIKRPAVTVAMMAQPDVIRGAANKPGARERGVIGRFLMTMPKSLAGKRKADPPPVPDEAWKRYSAVVRRMLSIADPKRDGGAKREHFVLLSPAARAAYVAFVEEVEPKLDEDEGDLAYMADWANKLCGAAVRIAGILHFAEAAASGEAALREAWHAPISETSMLCGIEFAWYFLSHAIPIYGEMLVSREARASRDRVGDMAKVLWSFDRPRRGVTGAAVTRALFIHGHKGPVPDDIAAAREAVRAFAGAKGPDGPTPRALGKALAEATGEKSEGLRIVRLGENRDGVALWSWAPASEASAADPSRGYAANPAETPHPNPADFEAKNGFEPTVAGFAGFEGPPPMPVCPLDPQSAEPSAS